ncbi:hypothetical protein FACS1894201_03730 [Bacteroidia bacterium]|nr:hypothetical protein FACS1894201_03730 [Bacteroidia bacterium]
MQQLQRTLGILRDGDTPTNREDLRLYINLQLEVLGFNTGYIDGFESLTKEIIGNFRERNRNINESLCPADIRIQQFLQSYFSKVQGASIPKLPSQTFCLDFYGIARELSLPVGYNEYFSEYVRSYRVKQGVLHNPRNDRRTTKGVFHIAEGGLPIPADKKAVPIQTAAYLFGKAFSETGEIMTLPYTANCECPSKTWVSLLLRPVICPKVSGIHAEKSMEIRFFAPGSLVSNLDFVESIFGNQGNPYHLFNDAALDVKHWSGHTGCVILAPQLTMITKREAGLPPVEQATERQKRDGMCWASPDELYNDGQAFKLTVRTDEGIIVTVIADNYFGYSKKEVKTQMSYACNLYGNTEEEHSGGAFIFPAYTEGDTHIAKIENEKDLFGRVMPLFSDKIDMQPEGYGVDKQYPNILYVRENTCFDLVKQRVSWILKGKEVSIKLLPDRIYFMPNGVKLWINKVPGMNYYRLVECASEGSLFHKPSTVSGGGKSEISKSLFDAIFTGSFYVKDFESDIQQVREIINKDYTTRFKEKEQGHVSRSFLSSKRSIGSVIKLLTPSSDNTDEFNAWLESVPQYIKGFAFTVKRFYHENLSGDWMKYFSVDILNGQSGNELRYQGKKLFAHYLRVGFDKNGSWRTFKLRQDFTPAVKLQTEDDITASTVVPVKLLGEAVPSRIRRKSVKFVTNCESRFFQRPDEAIVRGFDKRAELDLSTDDTFISNFEPLTVTDAVEMLEDTNHFEQFTEPMRNLIRDVATKKDVDYFVSSANPRLIDGKPSKNVRYLQTSGLLTETRANYVAEMGMRLSRRLSFDKPLFLPVTDVLPGRRNNPAENDTKPLAVYNPLHYQELPELFMDFLSSLTGKSPSTTGAGSEGALTKAPFNALLPIIDLNNALISYILTDYPGYTTPAGYIGPHFRIDHDLSLLIPEVWARLKPQEKNPQEMMNKGFLEKIDDFEYKGQTVRASILGYRITDKFINSFFGRVFENPNVVFSEDMLKPELQDMDEFIQGIENIVTNQKRVAEQYFLDGSYELAIPPLQALLSIMVKGNFEGLTMDSPEFRKMFTYDYLIQSDFYQKRLKRKQEYDVRAYEKHIQHLETALATLKDYPEQTEKLQTLLTQTIVKRDFATSEEYTERLRGTLGLGDL